jgi:hypothetical protein
MFLFWEEFLFQRLQKEASGLNFEGPGDVNCRALVTTMICKALLACRLPPLKTEPLPGEMWNVSADHSRDSAG